MVPLAKPADKTQSEEEPSRSKVSSLKHDISVVMVNF